MLVVINVMLLLQPYARLAVAVVNVVVVGIAAANVVGVSRLALVFYLFMALG